MDDKEITLLSKDSDIKLKDLIFDYLEISIEDLNKNINDPELFKIIGKYNKMLINIKNVCVYRNKF